jgi:5,10-methylenetetrahydromethanopterin reductase
MSDEHMTRELGIANLIIDPLQGLIPIAQAADEAGVSCILLPDNSPSLTFRDVFVALTTVALNTKRITLEVGVSPIYTRHPVYLAIAAGTLQEISGGRFILGLGPGGNMTLAPFGIPIWDKPIRHVREAYQLISQLQDGKEVTWDNPYFKCRKVRLQPTPQPRVPQYLSARGPQMTKLAGRIADGVMFTSPLPAIKDSIRMLHEGIKQAGRRKEDVKITNWLMTYITDKMDKKGKERICTDLGFQVANTVDGIHEACGVNLDDVNTLRKVLNTKGPEESRKYVTQEMIDAYSIVAAPDEFLDRIMEFYKAGVDQVGIIDPIGPDPIKTIKQIGEDIIPHLQ